MTVRDLIRARTQLPPEALVMLAVVKYPDLFEVRKEPDGTMSWDKSEAVEVCPLERGEIYLQGNEAIICVELVEYAEVPGTARHT